MNFGIDELLRNPALRRPLESGRSHPGASGIGVELLLRPGNLQNMLCSSIL